MLFNLLLTSAYAEAAAAPQPSLFQSLLPILLIFAVFYFLLIRPQAKRAKAHADTLSSLKRGDEVITAGGLYGRVEGLTDEFVTLDIADGVKVKVVRRQIASKLKGNQK